MSWINPFGAAVVALSGVALLVAFLSGKLGSLPLAIVSRWLRWVLFAAGTTYLMFALGVSSGDPWVTFVMAFVGWFFLETLFYWFSIAALSRGPYPLFPHFSRNEDGDEWPAQNDMIQMRDWLREEGFQRREALKAPLGPGVDIRLSIYQDSTNLTRLQVLFLPQGNGRVIPSVIVSSQDEDKNRLVTDNVYIPYGGFYPETWWLERRPLNRSIGKLVARHRYRVEHAGWVWREWDSDPLAEINMQQRTLEQINTELGFLFPRHLQDEHGMLTWAGRMRVWRELWMLNYLGRALGY